MAARKKAAPKTFKAAYQILKNNAEALRNTNEPDIDNLMTTVEQSIAAYKVCQSRIEAVQQALDAAFDEDAIDININNENVINEDSGNQNSGNEQEKGSDAGDIENNSI